MKTKNQFVSASDNYGYQILCLIRAFPRRFAAKVAVDPKTKCWNWTGATKASPKHPEYRYPVYSVDGTSHNLTGAHQFAYQFTNGLLLPGLRLDVDHKCQNKLCVNPRHLRAITHQHNCQLRRKRARVPGSKRWLKEQVAK